MELEYKESIYVFRVNTHQVGFSRPARLHFGRDLTEELTRRLSSTPGKCFPKRATFYIARKHDAPTVVGILRELGLTLDFHPDLQHLAPVVAVEEAEGTPS